MFYVLIKVGIKQARVVGGFSLLKGAVGCAKKHAAAHHYDCQEQDQLEDKEVIWMSKGEDVTYTIRTDGEFQS